MVGLRWCRGVPPFSFFDKIEEGEGETPEKFSLLTCAFSQCDPFCARGMGGGSQSSVMY